MSDSLAFLTPVLITWEMMAQQCLAMGGRTVPDWKECVIERENAVLYVFLGSVESAGFEEFELAEIAEQIHACPQSLLEIRLGHDSGSPELAREIVRCLIEAWGGTLSAEDMWLFNGMPKAARLKL